MKNRLLLVALIISSLCGLGFYRNNRTQWEYKFIQTRLDFKKTDVMLTELGAQGWEVYAVSEDGGIANFYMKRPRQ